MTEPAKNIFIEILSTISYFRYMLTMNSIAEALIRARDRGVTVRIISDQSMIATSGSRINRLQSGGEQIEISFNIIETLWRWDKSN